MIDQMKVTIKDTQNKVTITDIKNQPVNILDLAELPCINRNNIFSLKWLIAEQSLPYGILGRPGLDKICYNWRQNFCPKFHKNNGMMTM